MFSWAVATCPELLGPVPETVSRIVRVAGSTCTFVKVTVTMLVPSKLEPTPPEPVRPVTDTPVAVHRLGRLTVTVPEALDGSGTTMANVADPGPDWTKGAVVRPGTLADELGDAPDGELTGELTGERKPTEGNGSGEVDVGNGVATAGRAPGETACLAGAGAVAMKVIGATA
jgi:hypothetical protein